MYSREEYGQVRIATANKKKRRILLSIFLWLEGQKKEEEKTESVITNTFYAVEIVAPHLHF